MLQVIILSTNKGTVKGLKKIIDTYMLDKLVSVNIEVMRDVKMVLKTDVSGAILFIDNMAGRNSVKTAEILREHDCSAAMVVLTSDHELVYEAFKVQAHRVLQVPIASRDVYEAIDSFIKQKLSNKVIIVKDGGQKITLPINEILYATSNDRDVKIVTKNGETRVTVPLFQITAQLPEEFFNMCHRSFCVNLMNIRTVSRGIDLITMVNGSTVPISRRRKSDFVVARERFMENHTFTI